MFGIANQLEVKQILGSEKIESEINIWLLNNPDVEVVDIKFSTSHSDDEWHSDALIIYRK